MKTISIAIYLDVENIQGMISLEDLLDDIRLQVANEFENVDKAVFGLKKAIGDQNNLKRFRNQLSELNFTIEDAPHIANQAMAFGQLYQMVQTLSIDDDIPILRDIPGHGPLATGQTVCVRGDQSEPIGTHLPEHPHECWACFISRNRIGGLFNHRRQDSRLDLHGLTFG